MNFNVLDTPSLKYVVSPNGIIHLVMKKGETYCQREITEQWTQDDNIAFRAWRGEQNKDKEICSACDKYRQEYYCHFAPFKNSTHL